MIRAVSFFGEAGFETTPEAGGAATPEGGAGLSGTVGLPLSGGGFGGGVTPLSGLVSGPPGGGGIGGPGGFGGGGGIEPEPGRDTFEVSFFGDWPEPSSPEPGTATRTVSRFATGPSVVGGRVIRMVSLFEESSSGEALGEGFSSAMALI